MKILKLFSLIIWLCLFYPFVYLSAQITAKDDFEILRVEAGIYQKYQQPGPVNAALIDSADYYAELGAHEIAVVFLEQFLAQINENSKTAQPVNVTLPASKKTYDLVFKTGIDYNYHEFEIGYLQNDSILVDEIQKPFVGLTYSKYLLDKTNRYISIETDIRYDKANFTSSADLSVSINKNNLYLKANTGLVYDKNTLYTNLSYLEPHGRQALWWSAAKNWQVQVNNYFRFKNYENATVTTPDFIRDQFDINLINNDFYNHYLKIAYEADLNESRDTQHNDYFEQRALLYGEFNPASFIRNNVQTYYAYKTFAYVLSDSVFSNKSRILDLNLENIFRLSSGISWNLHYNIKYKKYNLKTEQEPDYHYHSIHSALNKRIGDNISLEGGYVFEYKKHDVFSEASAAYIEEQNFLGNGVSVGFDYYNRNAFFVTINSSYLWRRYPDAQNESALTIYSNRNIFNLFVMIQLPLIDKFSLNVFGAYDNDQDVDTDENNTRSSLFSAELQYRF